MAGRFEKRSRDAPMDFEFTDRDRMRSVLAPSSPFHAALSSPKKRSHEDLPFTPTGSFVFPTPSTPHPPPFPEPQHEFEVELADVSMTDASPARVVEMPQPQPHSHDVEPQKNLSQRKKTSSRRLNRGEDEDYGNDEYDYDEYEDGDDSDGRRRSRPGPLRRARERERQRLLGGGAVTGTPRRRRVVRRATVSSDDEDAEEGVGGAQGPGQGMTVYMQARAPELAHADVPRVLVGYVQFLFNLSVVLVILYLALALILTVQRDVEQRVSEYSLGVLAEISTCRQHWTANHCASPTHAAPILAAQCAEWAACMARDPSFVGRARVAAETLGEVVDGFVAPLSWKTLVFASCTVVLVNVLLSLYRASPHHPHPHPHSLPHPAQPAAQGLGWLAPSAVGASHDETSARRRIA